MPAFGGLTISARWPLPSGLTMLIRRWLRFFGIVLEVDQLEREDRGQVTEDRAPTGGVGVDAIDRIDPEHAPVLLVRARGADRAADPVADPQAEPTDLAGTDVDVVRAREEAVTAEKAEALVDDIEDAAGVGVAGSLRLALENALDEIVLALLGAGFELQVTADRTELVDAHVAEVGDVQVVPLAGGLELLLLLELRDRGARSDLVAAARPPIAGTLVGTELGHECEVTSGDLTGEVGRVRAGLPRGIAPLRRPVWDAADDTRRRGPRQWRAGRRSAGCWRGDGGHGPRRGGRGPRRDRRGRRGGAGAAGRFSRNTGLAGAAGPRRVRCWSVFAGYRPGWCGGTATSALLVGFRGIPAWLVRRGRGRARCWSVFAGYRRGWCGGAGGGRDVAGYRPRWCAGTGAGARRARGGRNDRLSLGQRALDDRGTRGGGMPEKRARRERRAASGGRQARSCERLTHKRAPRYAHTAMTDVAAMDAGIVAGAIRERRLIAVLRRVEPRARLIDVVGELVDDGIGLFEITFDGTDAAADVAAVRAFLGAGRGPAFPTSDRRRADGGRPTSDVPPAGTTTPVATRDHGALHVGAGTIRTTEQLAAAVNAGAAFGVSPILDPAILAAARAAHLPFVPGAATPTEADVAWRCRRGIREAVSGIDASAPPSSGSCADHCPRSRRS